MQQEERRCWLAVAYFPSSSYSWYSSVNLVEVTIVAMLTEVKGTRGGFASRRFREDSSWRFRGGRQARAQAQREEQGVGGEGAEAGVAVVTKILYTEDGSLWWKRQEQKLDCETGLHKVYSVDAFISSEEIDETVILRRAKRKQSLISIHTYLIYLCIFINVLCKCRIHVLSSLCSELLHHPLSRTKERTSHMFKVLSPLMVFEGEKREKKSRRYKQELSNWSVWDRRPIPSKK